MINLPLSWEERVFEYKDREIRSICGQPNYSAHADLDPDGVINVQDVFKLMPPVFGYVSQP